MIRKWLRNWLGIEALDREVNYLDDRIYFLRQQMSKKADEHDRKVDHDLLASKIATLTAAFEMGATVDFQNFAYEQKVIDVPAKSNALFDDKDKL